jgi:hypothetical protein
MIKLLISNFYQFSTTGHGSVCSVLNDIGLNVYYCKFIGCKGTGSTSCGGAVYVSAQRGPFLMRNTCASQCTAYNGFVAFVFFSGNDSISMDQVTTTDCSGSFKCVFRLIANAIKVNNYNASYNAPVYDSDVWSESAKFLNEAFHNYYKNRNDALFVDVSGSGERYLTKSNFISNTHSNKRYGYVHINSGGATLYATYLNFYGNSNPLFDCCNGILIAERIQCDVYSYQTEHYAISTTLIYESSGYTIPISDVYVTNICQVDKIYNCTNKNSVISYCSHLFSLYVSILS